MSGTGLADLWKPTKVPPPPLDAKKHTLEDDEQENDMGRPRKDGTPAAPPKQKRKYTRRKPAAADLKSLAAAHLHAVVVDQVDLGDNEPLKFALDNFARAKAIYEAV